MDLNLSEYYPVETFSRNGVDCVLCRIRNRLIIKTPEEYVRQAFINYLVYEKKVPANKIRVEFPLSRIKNNEKKRADVIVYDNDDKKVVLVIECKKGDWGLTDRDFEQAKYYNSVLKADCIVITNGNYHLTYKVFNKEYKKINIIPTYENLLNKYSLKKHIVQDYPYKRGDTLEEYYSKETHDFFLECGFIGVDTKKELYPFISNLIDLVFDADSIFENLHFNGNTILKDLGTSKDSFGNAAGGNWNGDYKKFLVRDKNGDHQTIGIGIFGSAKYENHPRFGNSKGYTYLIVSIDDYEKSHNSLQLNIDKNVNLINGIYYINHNGKLTNGHSGSIKFDVVKNYLKKHAPNLLTSDNTIQLGAFPEKMLYLHSDQNSINFITNLIQYAILRDEIRRGRT